MSIHHLSQLALLAQDKPTEYEPWFIFLSNTVDEHVDSFHHAVHTEEFCALACNPHQRFPPATAINDQGQEQIWAELGKMIPSLNHRTEGRFKFLLHMVIMLRDLWREKACVKELGTRTFEPLGQGYGHGVERHAAFALKAKNAREVSMRKDAACFEKASLRRFSFIRSY